jgi:hypothetical protein
MNEIAKIDKMFLKKQKERKIESAAKRARDFEIE